MEAAEADIFMLVALRAGSAASSSPVFDMCYPEHPIHHVRYHAHAANVDRCLLRKTNIILNDFRLATYKQVYVSKITSSLRHSPGRLPPKQFGARATR